MSDLRLSIAINDYVHTHDVVNGVIRPIGIDLTALRMPFESAAFRFGANLEFDISEFGLAAYCARLSRPEPCPFIALPVFTSRVFRHSSIYINTASGIGSAADLKGRTIGIPQWSQTATIYVRGYLMHDAGVPLASIAWVQAGVDEAGREDHVELSLPQGVRLTTRPDKTLSGIDAAITARPPQCFLDNVPGVRRLFPDYRAEEQLYFERTRIFPIMHVIAIRRSVYDANPWIARNLFDAFEQSKRAALARLSGIQTSHLPTAWAPEEMASVHKLLFADSESWPYGLEANRPTLEPFLSYCDEQGVTKRKLSADELFPPELALKIRI
jgi:4,5-dihydroxyphthalate decarboxylase